MKTSPAMLLPLIVTLAGACVVTSSPPPPTDGPRQPPPPPPPTTAAPPPPPPATTTPPVVTPTPTTTPTATATPPGGGMAPTPSVVGRWVSPSCGARTYARKIEFTATGTFEAHDLVSPCPPKVACVWSGIVDSNGTYTIASGMIKLAVAQPGNPRGQPLPATLAIDPTTSAPLETGSSGKCPYTKDTSKP